MKRFGHCRRVLLPAPPAPQFGVTTSDIAIALALVAAGGCGTLSLRPARKTEPPRDNATADTIGEAQAAMRTWHQEYEVATSRYQALQAAAADPDRDLKEAFATTVLRNADEEEAPAASPSARDVQDAHTAVKSLHRAGVEMKARYDSLMTPS
jgi:hypothetical protein